VRFDGTTAAFARRRRRVAKRANPALPVRPDRLARRSGPGLARQGGLQGRTKIHFDGSTGPDSWCSAPDSGIQSGATRCAKRGIRDSGLKSTRPISQSPVPDRLGGMVRFGRQAFSSSFFLSIAERFRNEDDLDFSGQR
jgi:hypothetical protein